MKTVQKKYVIKAPIEKVWQALVDPNIIEKWGAGSAKMTDKENFEFSLWGGDIFGKNTKVIPKKILEQDWYGGKWEQPSKVVFTLLEKSGITELSLAQNNIPDSQAENIDSGWDDYYLGAIKDYLEK